MSKNQERQQAFMAIRKLNIEQIVQASISRQQLGFRRRLAGQPGV